MKIRIDKDIVEFTPENPAEKAELEALWIKMGNCVGGTKQLQPIGTYVPAEVSEYVAIDIGLIGPGYDGEERKVTICAKDASTPYDYELTSRLIDLAEAKSIDHAVDIFYRYGTDANAALKAGNNLRAAAFGMAVYCSHGMERTHMDGLKATTDLLLSYLLEY